VFDGLNDVTSAGSALGANHRCSLVDATKRLAKVLGSAHKRQRELLFVNVVTILNKIKRWAKRKKREREREKKTARLT
jgi:hypothetical protein